MLKKRKAFITAIGISLFFFYTFGRPETLTKGKILDQETLMQKVANAEWPSVKKICIAWRKRDPQNLVPAWLLMIACSEQNQMTEASRLYCYLELFEKAAWEQVLSFAQRMVRQHEKNGIAWALLSYAQGKTGQKQEELESAKKAISFSPNIPFTWINLGVVLGDSLPEEELKCYDHALQIKPDHAGAWHNKGCVYLLLGQVKKAVNCFNQALKVAPNYVQAWDAKGIALVAKNRFQDAMNCFDRAIKIAPKCTRPLINKGNVLLMLGRFQEAVWYYDKVLEIKPRSASAWYNKGYVCFMQGEYVKARRCFERAAELGSDAARTALDALSKHGH